MAERQDAIEVGKLRGRANVQVGKPRRITAGVSGGARTKVAFGASGGASGGMGGNFYSPELSTDFLELPQSQDEQRNFYRFFYRTQPFVYQAINIHTELPLSKIRLNMPVAKNRDLAEKAMRFCEKWATRVNLSRRLVEIVHEYHLLGEVFVFMEDNSPDMPDDITKELVRELKADGSLVEYWQERADKDERAAKWLKKNFKGWSAVRILPPEQVHMESFTFTDAKIVEFIPDSKTKNLIGQADSGDANALRIVSSMPSEVVESIKGGQNLTLNTDPSAGSFVHYLARKMSQYDPRGHSALEPCMRSLVFMDKCLVAGTPVWVKRDGIIQSVPVETINTETDLLLTHKGNFSPAIAGSREVSEDIISIKASGVQNPVQLTGEHRVFVMTSKGLVEKEAHNLKAGDLLCEALLQRENSPLLTLDLVTWWQSRTLEVPRRYRPNQRGYEKHTRTLDFSAMKDYQDSLQVSFSYPQDDANLVDGLAKRKRLLIWLATLESPTWATYAQIETLTGLSQRDIQNYAFFLRREIGLVTESKPLGRGKGRATLWHPLPEGTPLPRETVNGILTSPIAHLSLDEQFCYLLGTWLGDGDVWESDSNILGEYTFGWTGSSQKPSVINNILRIAQDIFGAENVSTEHPFGESAEGSVKTVRVLDSLFSSFLREEFGHSAKGKHLPDWIFQLGASQILALLQGLLDTDGCLKMGKNPTIQFQMANSLLLDQVHLLCSQIGLHTTRQEAIRKARTWTRTWKVKGGFRTKEYSYPDTSYSLLSCGRFQDVYRWATGSIKGSEVPWPQQGTNHKSLFVDGYLTRKITSITKVPYTGPVYSFDVPGDLSHTAGWFIVHNCRQAQTSIASRHMTPMRVVALEKGASIEDVEAMRDQIDMALMDPDYSIITNYEVNWQEMGSESRLLDLTSEYELINRQLYAGLGVTEALLTGESSYSGERISLDVINTRYMLLREELQEFVEQFVFKPMCARMGFIEEDEDGDEVVLFPKLTFTRLGLRDNDTTYEHMFALYTKGSLDVGTILELLNLDPVTVKKKIEEDLWSVNDPMFNEMIRGVYSAAAQKITESSDIIEIIAKKMGIKYEAPKEGADARFGM